MEPDDALASLRESENLYRCLVERSNDGVVVLQDRLIKFVNRRFVELSGFSEEELLETIFTDHLAPDEIPNLLGRYEKRMAGEPVPPVYETAVTRKDGTRLPFEVSAAVMPFNGRPADLIWVRDITERKLAEEYLQRYRLLSETTRDVILFVEFDGRIIEANRAAADVYGYPHEELLDLTVYDLRIEEEHNSVSELLESAQRENVLFEAMNRTKDGRRFPVEVSMTSASLQGRGVLLAIVRDISRRKQAEAVADAALQEARREQRRSAALESIAEASLTSPRLPELLNTVVERIADALNVDASCVFVLDEKAQEFVAHAAYNVPGLLGCRIRVNEGLMGKVASELRPIYVADAENDPLAFDSCEVRTLAKTMLGIPLISRGRLVGVTRVQSLLHREFTADDLRLLQAIAERVAMAIDNARLYDELEHSRRDSEEALEHERHFSLMLQSALLPERPSLCKRFTVAVGYVPVYVSRQVGGDFYDLFMGQNNLAAALIGDVSGKGLEAASLAAATRSTVHAFTHENCSPAEVLNRTNSVLFSEQSLAEAFVTVSLVRIDPFSGRILYSSAGHPPPVILRSDGSIEFLRISDLPLAVAEDYLYSEAENRLEIGDKLVMYTDGITEARGGAEMFDMDGVERTLAGHGEWHPQEVVDKLISEATDWAQGKLRDDAAVLVLEMTGEEDAA